MTNKYQSTYKLSNFADASGFAEGKGTELDTIHSDIDNRISSLESSPIVTDEKVKVSAADTTSVYLQSALQGTSALSVTTVSAGGGRSVSRLAVVSSMLGTSIARTSALNAHTADSNAHHTPPTDFAGIGSNGLVPDPTAGTTTRILKADGTWAEPSGGADEKAKVSATDTTTDYLGNKIVAGQGIDVATINPGANEQIQISATPFGVPLYKGRAEAIADGVDIYLRNDAGSGVPVEDIEDNVASNNNASWTAGKFFYTMSYNGVNTYTLYPRLSTPTDTRITYNAIGSYPGKFTFSCWFNPRSVSPSTSYGFLSFNSGTPIPNGKTRLAVRYLTNGSNNISFQLYVTSSDGGTNYVFVTGQYDPLNPIVLNQFNHVLFTFNGSLLGNNDTIPDPLNKIYLNGQALPMVQDAPSPGYATTTLDSYTLGAIYNTVYNQYGNYLLDEVIMYANKTMEDVQITTPNYNQTYLYNNRTGRMLY